MVDEGANLQTFGSLVMDTTARPPMRRGEGRPSPKKRKVEDYKHYAAIVADDDGRCHMVSSPSLKRHKRTILAQAMAQAREILVEVQHPERMSKTKPPPMLPDVGSVSSSQNWDESDVGAPQAKRQRVQAEDRQRNGAYDAYAGQSEGSPFQEVPETRSVNIRKEVTIPEARRDIRPSEAQQWYNWFSDGFTLIQQTACRTIAKEWIKVIHPKKQSTHPYNGKVPRNLGDDADPERTKPPYWPPNVRHKEPDHIDKAARTKLLVHLLMHTPQEEIVPDKAKSERSFTARDLLNALQKKQDEGVTVKWAILQELIYIREILENYEQGGMDDEATITVPDWSAVLHAAGSRKKVVSGAVVPTGSTGLELASNESDEVASDTTEEISSGRDVTDGLPPSWGHDLKHEVFTRSVLLPTKMETAGVKAEPRSLITQPSRPSARKGLAIDYGLAPPFYRGVVGYGDTDASARPGAKNAVPQQSKLGTGGWPRAPADIQHAMMLNYSGLLSPGDAVSMGETLGMGGLPSYGHLPNDMQNAIAMPPYSTPQSYIFDGDRVLNGGYLFDSLSHVDRDEMSTDFGQNGRMYQH